MPMTVPVSEEMGSGFDLFTGFFLWPLRGTVTTPGEANAPCDDVAFRLRIGDVLSALRAVAGSAAQIEEGAR